MNTPTPLYSLAALCAGTLLAAGAHAQSVEILGFIKTIDNEQTSATHVTIAPADQFPFEFHAGVEGVDLDLLPAAPIVSGAFNNPEPGHNGGVLGYNFDDESWDYGFPNFEGWAVQTQAELDSLFGSGTYSFNVDGLVVPLVLAGDVYPPVPLLTLTGGSWDNGIYVIAPDQELTITTSAYADYGTHVEDAIWLGFFGPNFEYDALQFASSEPTNFATVTIPAGSLLPGTGYDVDAGFVALTGFSDSIPGMPNALAVAGYEQATNLFVLVSGSTLCPADLNNDGLLDFFDVQAFLNAYASHDPSADFNDDGLFDFFDVQTFLNLYSAGCP